MTAEEVNKDMSAEKAPIIYCRLCATPAVDIYHMPGGCVCAADPVQALCAQHAAKASPLDGMSSITYHACVNWGQTPCRTCAAPCWY